MAKPIFHGASGQLLSIGELEDGIKVLDAGGSEDFWDEHVDAFRDTVVDAIRETCEILDTEDMPRRWRAQLNRQVEAMRKYVCLADFYLATRTAGSDQPPRSRLN